MPFFVVDEDGRREYATLAEALDDASESIDAARDCCDPQWPSWVESISIYEAPAACECPDEDGKHLYCVSETDVREAEDGSGCDYFCDYEMREVSHDR